MGFTIRTRRVDIGTVVDQVLETAGKALISCGVRERRASGVSCRVRRPFGQLYTKVAVFALPTDAAGTKGDFEGETTSIVASFDFHPLKTRELG